MSSVWRFGFAALTMLVASGLTLLGLSAYYDPPDVPDAEVVWSAAVGAPTVSGQAATGAGEWYPVATDDLVVVGGPHGVSAHDPSDGAELWRVDLRGLHSGWIAGQSALAIARGRIYASTATGVVALDRETGEEAWRHELPPDGFIGMRVFSGHVAILVHVTETRTGGVPAYVVVLDRDGEEIWEVPLRSSLGTFAADATRVFVEDARSYFDDDGDMRTESDLVAFGVTTGEELWRIEGDGPLRPYVSGDHLAATVTGSAEGTDVLGIDPATSEELWRYEPGEHRSLSTLSPAGPDRFAVIAFEHDGVLDAHHNHVIGLDARTGEEVWSAPIDGFGSGLTWSDEVIAVQKFHPEAGPRIVALDTSTGDRWWEAPIEGASRPDNFRAAGAAHAVYYVDGSRRALLAFSAGDGSPRWSARLAGTGAQPDDAPIVADDVVYLTADGLVRAFDASSGERLWEERLGTVGFSQPTVAGDAVFAVTGLGSVRAYDRADGSSLWRSETRLDSVGQALRPSVVDGLIVAGAEDLVWALDAANGTGTWEISLDGEVAGIAPSAAGIVIGSTNGTVALLDVTSGEAIWTADVGGPVTTRPVVDDAVVVVAADDAVHGLDLDSGASRWSRPLDGSGAAPTLVAGVVYVPDLDTLRALDATTGDELWSTQADSQLTGTPSVADGNVHVVLDERSVLVLDETTGEQAGRIDVAGPGPDGEEVIGRGPARRIAASPTAGNGLVFVVTNRGELLALR